MKTKIQILREERKMTVGEIRNITKIPKVSYYRYEHGQRIPDAVTAIRIAKALGTTVENLWNTQ